MLFYITLTMVFHDYEIRDELHTVYNLIFTIESYNSNEERRIMKHTRQLKKSYFVVMQNT